MGSDGTLPSAPEINTTKSDSGNDTVMHTTSTVTKPYPLRKVGHMDYTTPFSLVMHDRQPYSNTLNNIGYLYTYYTTVSVSEVCLVYKSLMNVFL